MALIASRGIGGAGTMEIHDDGWTVTMRFRSADGQTNSGGIPWRAIINGGWTPNADGRFGAIRYSTGSPWVTVGAWGLGASQTVTFEIGNTGTWGLGAGGSLSAAINRTPPATRPAPPTAVQVYDIGHTDMKFQFVGNSDGGSAITGWFYQMSERSDFADVGWSAAPGNGIVHRTDLRPGRTYYWRARGQNAVGTSDPSGTLSGRTRAGIRVRVNGQWREAVPMVKVNGVWRDVVPYAKVSGQWRALG